MNGSNQHPRLSTKALKDWMEDRRPFFLIHTLGNDHFRKVHIPGAINACVFEVSFLDQVHQALADKPTDPIIVYGSSSRSMDAVTAADKLTRAGYQNILLLDGGLEAWRSAGLTLEGESVNEPDSPQTHLVLKDNTYGVDLEQSKIDWSGRNPNTTHFGSLSLAAGELVVRDGQISGHFDIDMTAITNQSLAGDEYQPVLIDHLNSDDFFLTSLFPKARYTILEAIAVPNATFSMPNYALKGTLELRGIKARQDFMATVTNTPQYGLAAEAHFDMDRTQWGIIYGSTRFFEHLGMHLIFDLISLQVRIVTFDE